LEDPTVNIADPKRESATRRATPGSSRGLVDMDIDIDIEPIDPALASPVNPNMRTMAKLITAWIK